MNKVLQELESAKAVIEEERCKSEKKKQLLNHPVVGESLELKMFYLNGLALMMNVDEEISESEKEFFVDLIEAFQLDPLLDDFLDFAKNPEPKKTQELLRELAKSGILRFYFILDAVKIANMNGNCNADERESLNYFLNLLAFSEKEKDFLKTLYEKKFDAINYLDEVKEMIIRISTPQNMVSVKGGTFHMGSSVNNSEKPVHAVTVSDFYIGKYQITQKEWREIMGNNPSYFKGDNLPVERVNWFEAVEFCNLKSQKEGLTNCYSNSGNNVTCNWEANGYRLPTEAEWEYAARGGCLGGTVLLCKNKQHEYSGSDNIDEVAWYGENSGKQTHDVGTKKANEIGIYDMSGNVWEWCWDWHGNYSTDSQTNPRGPSSGSNRVLRGGSWDYDSDRCRVASRNDFSPHAINSFGFRILRTL